MNVDVLYVFLVLLLSIGLAVFVTNAEMLESKYYIGVKQTFRVLFWLHSLWRNLNLNLKI